MCYIQKPSSATEYIQYALWANLKSIEFCVHGFFCAHCHGDAHGSMEFVLLEVPSGCGWMNKTLHRFDILVNVKR